MLREQNYPFMEEGRVGVVSRIFYSVTSSDTGALIRLEAGKVSFVTFSFDKEK